MDHNTRAGDTLIRPFDAETDRAFIARVGGRLDPGPTISPRDQVTMQAFFGSIGDRLLSAEPSTVAFVAVRGDLTLGHDKVAIDRLQAEFDRKAFSGNLAYAFARPGEPSRLEAVVRADELDLDGILDATGSVGTLADLRPEELAFSLSLGRLRVGGVDADSADVRLSLGA